MTSSFLSDVLGPGPRTVGPVAATCSVEVVVPPGWALAGASGTFERDSCRIAVTTTPAP